MPSRPRPAFALRPARSVPVLAAGLLAFATAALSAPPALAGIPVGPRIAITGGARIQGLPAGWRLEVQGFASGGSGTILLETETRNAARTATAEQQWTVNTASVSCTASLGSCTLDDQGGFGMYGRVKLVFEPRHAKVTRTLRCATDDAVIGTEVRRVGVLVGILRLDTRSKVAGVIRNGKGAHRVPLKLPVTVWRTVYNGTPCPIDPSTCGGVAHLRTTDTTNLLISRRLPAGKGTFSYLRDVSSAVATVERDQWVSGTLPGATLLDLQTADTLEAASVQMNAAPFLTGTLTFTAGTPKIDDKWLGCPDVQRDGQIAIDLTLRMPGRKKALIADEQAGTLAVETAP